jgi:hypothetical protein
MTTWLLILTGVIYSTAYCWGNFAGPFVVKQSEAPHFTGATIGLLVGYSIKLGCHVLLLGKYSAVPGRLFPVAKNV